MIIKVFSLFSNLAELSHKTTHRMEYENKLKKIIAIHSPLKSDRKKSIKEE